jgi:small subunit ribosomal protein S17e
MGRVRTKTIKRAAKVLLEKHYQKLTNDFHINKKILSEVAKVPTKSLRNKIAGYATHLVKRIQRGPVKGISLKVQEEEREKRLDWVPKESEINTDKVHCPSSRLPSITKLARCLRRDSVKTLPTRSAETLKSRLSRVPREMLEEVESEDPEVKDPKEVSASPEKTKSRRRKKSPLPLKTPLRRRLKISQLPSVKTEEEATVRANSDLYFKALTD